MLAARKVRYFGHVMRKSGDSLEGDLVTGSTECGRSRGRPPRSRMKDIFDWTDQWRQHRREFPGTHPLQYFGLGDVNGNIPPISLHTLTLAPQNTPKYTTSTSQNKQISEEGAVTSPFHIPFPLAFPPPTLNSHWD